MEIVVNGTHYEFTILDSRDLFGRDLACVHVEIVEKTSGRKWRGRTDLTRSGVGKISDLMPEWLGYAFRYYDPETIPDDFEIPRGIPQQGPGKHQCQGDRQG